MIDKIEKIGITAALSALFAWCGIIAIPFLLLVILQLIDYGTGLCAAKYRSEKINSYKSIRGIAKKICMWLLVAVGGIMDWLITYAANEIGIEIGAAFIVAIVVCVWLMCNEIISILENMADIGVDLPPFLLKIAKNIKDGVDKKTDQPDPDDSSDTDDL